MIIDIYFLAHIFVAIALFFTTFSVVPQLYLNMKLRSVKGISDGMLLGYYNLVLVGSCFVFCLEVPWLYRAITPISIALTLLLMHQRIVYNFNQGGKRFFSILTINTVLFLLIMPVAYWYPVAFGTLCGWTSFCLQFVYQLPQVKKILTARTTKGFSFGFIAIMTIGYCLELTAAFILGLPMAIKANDIRAIVMFIIFSIMFVYFPNK